MTRGQPLPRVLFTANYPMRRAKEEWEAGRYPSHHLWGTANLEQAGFPVELLPFRERVGKSKARSAIRSRLGDLAAESHALRARDRSIFYAADVSSFAGLAVMPSWLRRGRPVAAVIQPSVTPGRVRRRALLGYDVAIAISRVVYDDLIAIGRTRATTVLLPWGPDLDFAGYAEATDELIVCSGKTHRDHATLLTALGGVSAPARVHARQRFDEPLPEGVEARVAAPYAEVLLDLRRASVVVIPLLGEFGPVGITELNDALALGKPVVMTRNRYVDIDIEAIGCGIWVDRGDVRGWREALCRLTLDAGLRREMGARGRAFAEEHWNAELFGRGVVDTLSSLVPAATG